jgi:hypothetical protein
MACTYWLMWTIGVDAALRAVAIAQEVAVDG